MNDHYTDVLLLDMSAVLKEVGKNRKSAIEEVKRTADLLDYTAEEGLRVGGEVLHSDSFMGQKRDKVIL